ncbi:MAG: DUF3575 domain-containing protein [Bacteroidia bacterium]|nr:DUF3575 domain-containing protein [Bacteroidia bacterium]
MKYPLLIILLTLFSFQTLQAQDVIDQDVSDRNELKLNAFNLIAFTAIDINYERLINEEASFGTGLFINTGDDNDFGYYRTFSLTPYYRQFFSKRYAKGFFVEGFAMLNSGKEIYDLFLEDQGGQAREDSFTAFALGISVGGKFVTTRGFVAEIYAGIGRNLFGVDLAPEVIGRGGISLGFRF